LSETARPTLGRKNLLDQREIIPRVASSHEATYEIIRKKVLPAAEPPPATPAAHRWRREFFERVYADARDEPPRSEDLHIWATKGSLEARTMLAFSDLLARDFIGDIRILRAHLQDIYDFAFIQRVKLDVDSIPRRALADTLHRGGYADIQDADKYLRYGIGEFKASGEDILDDFDEANPRKAPDTPDLLVCWDFDQQEVEDLPWVVEEADPDSAEFLGQTHLWRPRADVGRNRPLPVIALARLLDDLVQSGKIAAPPVVWPDPEIPPVYY
jgi:hypothetical protein